MNNSEFKKVMDDIQLLKYKINNTLLMCNVIKDDLETIMAINDMNNDRTCTSGTTTTGYTGDNYYD